MSRGLTLLLCAVTLVVGCSRDPERSSATSPTATTAPQPGSLLGPTSVAPGGVSGKFDFSFPGRDQSFDFRSQLETFYRTRLGRAPAPTFVDSEGEVVWTQEYLRYRVNGCDHPTATGRVMSQIDGQPAGLVCGTSPDGLIVFPPRNDSFDFRRQLEPKYQQFGRGASQSAVDAEGGVVWTQEYLRYRVNQCDHPTSVQKVISQIEGGGVSPTCVCLYTVTPNTQAVPAAGGTFTAVIARTAGDCDFTAERLDSFIRMDGGTSGPGASPTTLTYTVEPNFGSARSGLIRVRWVNNSELLQINQAAGGGVAFTMTDPNAGSGVVTDCAIRTTTTPCVFNVTSGTFSANATYAWHIEYQVATGGMASHDFSSTDTTFRFTQTCGAPGSTAAGVKNALGVWLTVTDGNTVITVKSGEGGQPPLTITFFTC